MLIGSLLPTKGIWPSALADLAAAHPEHRFLLDPAEAERRLPDLDGLVANVIPESLIRAAKGLSALFVPFAGVNHLPVSLLRERGVTVYNSHGNAEEVAERALALTLAFYGRVIPYHEDLVAGRWHGFWVGHGAEDQWSSLYGRRVLILGAGAIGGALAPLLKAFRCEVTAFRRRAEAALPPGFDRVATDLPRAVADHEILVVALPLTEGTRGLLSRDLLLSARGKFLVNVGRGEVVDEEGLYLSLSQGILKGAALDTWYQYPPPGSDHGEPSRFPLTRLPNVVLSPHVAGSAAESAPKNVAMTCANIAAWLRGEGDGLVVDLRESY